jgi:predicted patatin/cPLA2 family phospholipase
VVLTHNHQFRLKPMPRWLGWLAYPEFPRVARVWTTGQCEKYNAALDLLRQPPAGVRLKVFRPMRPLPVGALTITQERIEAALTMGHDEALEQASLEQS